MMSDKEKVTKQYALDQLNESLEALEEALETQKCVWPPRYDSEYMYNHHSVLAFLKEILTHCPEENYLPKHLT